jgi:transposase
MYSDSHLKVSRGMCVEFLPPYSPDYNPIELTFSAMKYNLRRNGEYARFAITQLSDEEIAFTLRMALYEVSLTGTFGWFRHCGYV